MKKYIAYLFLGMVFSLASCVDNTLDVYPNDSDFPFRLILDTDEGGDLADAEDYGLEVKFADFIGDLPSGVTVTVDYEISDLTDDMIGAVEIDAIVYEIDDDEFELDFTSSADGLTGTITLNDPATNKIPEEFEVVFKLPGEEGVFYAAGSFKFSLSNLQSSSNAILLGTPYEFEYEVLDHELAGSWEFEIDNESDFESFKKVFAPISHDLDQLNYVDVLNGELKVEMEFEYSEVKIKIEYENLDGEEMEIEIEGEYDFEDGELEIEGNHEIYGDDGELEDELDFIIEGGFEINADELTITFLKIIDEDNYEDGEELYVGDEVFVFKKDN